MSHDNTIKPNPNKSEGNLIGGDSIRLDHLDGIRGLMAMWVFMGHLYFACTSSNLPIGPHGLAVDVFMVLSGFLMAFHWERRHGDQVTKNLVSRFYIKRFFRIAPLFYVIVIIAHFAHSSVSEMRIESITVLQPASEYTASLSERIDTSPLSFKDLLIHLTFLFGLIPEYVSSNNIPDWSISLEMQFYFIFPLLILLLRKIGPITIITAVVVVAMFTNRLIDVYSSADGFITFSQPSILPLKIHVFLVGMLLALAYNRKQIKKHYTTHLVLCALCLLDGVVWQVALCIFVIAAPLFLTLPRVDLGISFLSSRLLRFLGEISYGVYLIHNLLFYPILSYLVKLDWFLSLNSNLRFMTSAAICIPVVFGVATILYYLVELNGIKVGKIIDRKLCAK